MNMPKDQMTSLERTEALLNGQPTDRVPVIPFVMGHQAVICGRPVSDIYDNARNSFDAQCRAQEMYGYDYYPFYAYAMYGGWEFGGEVSLPKKEGESPIVVKYPIENKEDAEKFELPDDVTKAGCIPINLEFARIQVEHGMPAAFQATGPLSMGGCMTSIDNLMLWIIDSPELVHRICRKCTDFTLEVADHFIKEFGAENLYPILGVAIESNKLISPRHFEEFALPYIKEVVETLAAKGIPRFFVHICSDQIKNLPGYATINWPKRSIFTFGIEMPIKTVAEYFPGHIIAGHVDPLLIAGGTSDQVLEDSRRCIEEGKDIPGFALAPGCNVPAFSPPVNVFQMVKAARIYGQY
jgi:uroporphyrinogen decarboxylase